jgi:hypothetical protein
MVAVAVDDYQRDRLDGLGFRDGSCPDCRSVDRSCPS